MTRKTDKKRYEITWLIRRLFRAMSHNANERLVEFDITAADRAVMEFLHPDQELTVPEIASRYQVSRQHVQQTTNRLLEKRLVRTKSNPQHKRSPMLLLTAAGRKLFATTRENDAAAVKAAFAHIGNADVATTHKTLTALLRALD